MDFLAVLAQMFHRPIGEVLNTISGPELDYWSSRYRVELLGYERQDFQTGQVCATVATFAGQHLKEGVSVGPFDFMKFSRRVAPQPKTPEQNAQEIKLAFMTIAAINRHKR